VSLFRAASSSSVEIPSRPRWRRGPDVRGSQALQQSVVWASCRLRADLESLMPVDVFRKVEGVNRLVPTPPVLVEPSSIAEGHPMLVGEWIGTGRMGLDQHGNNWGIIHARDGLGLPARIDLLEAEKMVLTVRDGQITSYRYDGESIDPRYIWHERQYTIPGIPFGLSPIAHAAWQLKGSMSAQEWAVDWFANGAVPSAHLRNTERPIPDRGEAAKIKADFQASITNGEVFVTGKDWEYSALAAKAAESGFIQQMQYSDQALARFFGVPGDVIDVNTTTGSVTYANITQRNLQLLVLNMGGAIKRREDAFSRHLVANPRFVKLNRDAVLAMDAKTRADLFKVQIDARLRTPSEIRVLEDREPYTDEQYAEFDRLFGARGQAPQQQPKPTGGN